MPVQVINNEDEGQFEVHVGDEVAVIIYEVHDHLITLVHTEVPPALEGQGIAGQLARAALDYARAHGLTVIPQCPFVRSYLSRHGEYADIVDPRYRD